jgi:ABC-2 type transport system ATP-binding protein
MIEVRDLSHAYDGRLVLNGVSFVAAPGEVIGYLGPNGAGKSTTIKVLIGLLKPSHGTVRVLGMDPAVQPLEVRARIGYVPESGALYETLTPREYLAFVGRLHGLAPAVVAERTNTFLDAFQLRANADERMTGFSKGMKQKVVFAAALIHDPQVLFLDEPLNGLDANATVTVKEVIRGLAARGRTVFYSSHLMDVVERVTNRVVILDRGTVVADGPPEDLRTRTGDASLEAFFSRLTGGEGIHERSRGILGALEAAGPESPAP